MRRLGIAAITLIAPGANPGSYAAWIAHGAAQGSLEQRSHSPPERSIRGRAETRRGSHRLKKGRSMRLTVPAFSLPTTLVAGCLLAGCAEQLEDRRERMATGSSEAAVSVQIAYADCVAGGATAADTALANQLRPQMNGPRLGRAIDGYNVSCARIIVDTTRGRGLPSRGAVIAVTTAITESSLHNYTQAADHDSLGLFQQRPSQGWGTPAQITSPTYATNAFLNAMLQRFPNNSWMTGDIGAICQRVQVSAFPEAYSHEVHDAQLLVDALWN